MILPCQHCGKRLRVGEHWLISPGSNGSEFLFKRGIKTVDQMVLRRPVADLAWCSTGCALADGFPYLKSESVARRVAT